jgi:hypothetical protein
VADTVRQFIPFTIVSEDLTVTILPAWRLEIRHGPLSGSTLAVSDLRHAPGFRLPQGEHQGSCFYAVPFWHEDISTTQKRPKKPLSNLRLGCISLAGQGTTVGCTGLETWSDIATMALWNILVGRTAR